MTNKRSLESNFDVAFTASLAQREKQIQQNYRPVIGVHKWFARRPGTVFRNLLIAEFDGHEPVQDSFWKAHSIEGVIADPFMGGGTTIFEAIRLGLSVVGTDINPMAYWVVRQSISPLDLNAFRTEAASVIADVEANLKQLYETQCTCCRATARVKYFLWVKTQNCPECGNSNDLFPGYLLAEAERHPRHVVVCAACGHLNEYDEPPTKDRPSRCRECSACVQVEGPASRGKIACRACAITFSYPTPKPCAPPSHRLWAIEYHCDHCKPRWVGRMFKAPDQADLEKVSEASERLKRLRRNLPIPLDEVPDGDETRRLHRWGYARFCEMFNQRQLLGLGMLLRRIMKTKDRDTKHALLTVFSDFLRYQNMLCRYDTYALKCQDIFSVHGFPVGLVQCENNLLGIPRVGSGAFRHFIEKYIRAKEYCVQPFETMITPSGRKQLVPVYGESIEAKLVDHFPLGQHEVWLNSSAAEHVPLSPNSLDGVFTDPPYYDNVQYAELMDFCYAWLRQALAPEFESFVPSTTKTHAELTGNDTMKRGLERFTAGLSAVFMHFAKALKPGAPFVFTYHHNDPDAYTPLVVAILDAGLTCTETLPAPAEMAASLHIARSNSSVLDTIFVCRKATGKENGLSVEDALTRDVERLSASGMKLRDGDLRCLQAGHIARLAINQLRSVWTLDSPILSRAAEARDVIVNIRLGLDADRPLSAHVRAKAAPRRTSGNAAPV